MTTFTSLMLEHVSRYRNSAIEDNRITNYGIIALSEVAFIAIIPFAVVEAALTSIAFVFAKVILRIEGERIEPLARWTTRSSSAVLWSINLAVNNLITRRPLIATEEEWLRGHLFRRRQRQPVENPLIPIWTNPGENMLINPPEIDPVVAELLKPYTLGENALRYTDVFERIYQDLPNPTLEEIEVFSVDIREMLDKRLKHIEPASRPANLKYHITEIAGENPRSEANDHFIKILMCSYKTISAYNDPDEIEIMNSALVEANSACRTRRNDEILRLFMTIVAPRLDLPYLKAFTPIDNFTFDLMGLRIAFREQLFSRVRFNDTHDHNHFCRKLNEKIFYLPFPNLSDPEFRYDNYKEDEEQQVIRTFRACYTDCPAAVYNLFHGVLYTRPKEVFKYKHDMFVDWLKEKDLMNEAAFEDETMEKYKPNLLIRYLVENRFLQSR